MCGRLQPPRHLKHPTTATRHLVSTHHPETKQEAELHRTIKVLEITLILLSILATSWKLKSTVGPTASSWYEQYLILVTYGWIQHKQQEQQLLLCDWDFLHQTKEAVKDTLGLWEEKQLLKRRQPSPIKVPEKLYKGIKREYLWNLGASKTWEQAESASEALHIQVPTAPKLAGTPRRDVWVLLLSFAWPVC